MAKEPVIDAFWERVKHLLPEKTKPKVAFPS